MAYQLNLNWPEFLEKYWQKQPVVLKNAFPNFVDPITPDELAGLAMENEVDSRLVSHLDGKWQVSHGPFESYDHLDETNWSLLVQAVDHWHEPSAALMRPSKSVKDMELKSVKKKFKDKKFAAGCSRDIIRTGAERLGWELDELFAKTIEAMRSCEDAVNAEMEA